MPYIIKREMVQEKENHQVRWLRQRMRERGMERERVGEEARALERQTEISIQ